MSNPKTTRPAGFWARIEEALSQAGVDLEALASGSAGSVRCVVVAPNLRGVVNELSRTNRDQVVMVRLDDQTTATLDAWIETGAVRSRSEAAAVFIREGLKVHAPELAKLGEALQEVERARQSLRARMKEVLDEDAGNRKPGGRSGPVAGRDRDDDGGDGGA